MQLVGHGTISVFACSDWERLRMSLGPRITWPKFESIISQIQDPEHCHPSCISVGIDDSFFGDLTAGARSWILPYVSILNDIMSEKMVLLIDVLLILFGVVVPSTFRKNVYPSCRVEASKMGIFVSNILQHNPLQTVQNPHKININYILSWKFKISLFWKLHSPWPSS